MPIGPPPHFGKDRPFIDREACIQAFRENIQKSGTKEYNVLFYHGIAGIGKSKLQKELQKILSEEYTDILWAAIDLKTKAYREVGTFLVTLRNKIQEKCKANFYLFNTAHAIYWKKLHPEIPLPKENYPLFKEGNFFSKIVDILDEFGPARLTWDIINNAPESINRFYKEQAININILTAMEAHEIEKLLPGFFATDFTSNLGTDKKAYFFIDSYEALWAEFRNKGSYHEKDAWIRDNLIPNMPGVSWVICGREKLQWTEYDPDWDNYLEQRSINLLPESCCIKFLKDCNIEDRGIRDLIIKASEGVPYYLNLSVDIYEKIQRIRQPVPEDFGKAQPEIFNIFVKYLDRNEIRTLELLSAPNFWDRELFAILIKKFDSGLPIGAFSELTKFSFIKKDVDGKFSINQLMRKSLQEHQDSVDKEHVHQFMFEYYNSKLKNIDIKNITSEHEKALTEAFYHAKKTSITADLLNWFIVASDPFNRAAFWQLIAPVYEEILQILEVKLGYEHSDVATILNNLALLYERMGDYEKAFPLYQRALDIREKVLGPQNPDVATTLNNLAALNFQMGDYNKALPLYQRALDIREMVLGPQNPDVATTLNNLALLNFQMGDYEKSLPLYRRALDIREKVLGSQNPDVATTLNNLALLYFQMGDYEKSLPLYQSALDIREKVLGPQHPDVAKTMNNFALLYFQMGDYDKALILYQRTIRVLEKTLGKEHPDVATAVNGIAELYRQLGDYEKCLPLYQRALEIREKILGKEHPDVATAVNGIAELYRQLGDYEKCLPLYQRALEIREKNFGNEHPEVAVTINGIAELYKNIGDYEKSLPLYQQALEIRKKMLGSEHPEVAMTLNNISEIYHYLGKKDEALFLMEHVLKIYLRVLPSNHPSIATSLNNLGLLYQAKGESEKAKSSYQKALSMYEETLGPDHPSIAITLNNLATLYNKNKEYENALPLLKKALDINKKHFRDDNSEFALTTSNISALYVEMDKPAEATKYYKRAIKSYERILKKNPKNTLYQYLYAINLINFGKLLGIKNFTVAKKCYRKVLEIFTEPLNEKAIEVKSKAISDYIQLSYECSKNQKDSTKKEQFFYNTYQFYEEYVVFFSENGLEEQSKLVKRIGVNAYIQSLVLAAQREHDTDIRINKYDLCIFKVSQIAVEEDDEELKIMWMSILHYLEGRKLLNEATKSVYLDINLIKKAIEQFGIAKDKYEIAQACYCIYNIILELSETEVLNDESFSRIKELIEIAENTLKADMDQNLKSIFNEIKLLIKENTEEVDQSIFLRLNHYIENINYYALRKHFNYVAQKVMFAYSDDAKKKAGFTYESLLTTEFNKPEKEVFSPEVSYRNWTIEIKFNDFDKINGKVTINVEDKTLFSGHLKDHKKHIYHRLSKQEEIVEILDDNGNRVLRKISFLNVIECNSKLIDVFLYEQDCSKKNQEIDFVNIGIVQLKYHLYQEGHGIEIEDNPRYERKIFSILDTLVKKVDIVVFPEFSIPFKYLSALKKYSDDNGIIIIAGSHYIKSKNLPEYVDLFDVNFGEEDLLKNICPVIMPYSKEVSHSEKIFHTEKVCGAEIERGFLEEKMENGTLSRIFKFYDNLTCGVMICFDFLSNDLRSSIGKACSIVFIPQSNCHPSRFQLVADYDININPKFEHNIAYVMANGIFTIEKKDGIFGGYSGVILTLNKNSSRQFEKAIIAPVDKTMEQFVLICSLYTKYFPSRELAVGQIPLEMEFVHIYDEQDLITSGKRNVETFLEFLKEINSCNNSNELQDLIKNNEIILKECSPLMHKKLNEDLSDLSTKRIKNRCQHILIKK